MGTIECTQNGGGGCQNTLKSRWSTTTKI